MERQDTPLRKGRKHPVRVVVRTRVRNTRGNAVEIFNFNSIRRISNENSERQGREMRTEMPSRTFRGLETSRPKNKEGTRKG